MSSKGIDPVAAVVAYFGRIERGEASGEEYSILPLMLERYEVQGVGACDSVEPLAEVSEKFDGMSVAGKRGFFPEEGLVNAYEVALFIGKSGLKKPCISLMNMVREGRFPPPFDMGSKPYQWLAEDVRTWLKNFKTGRRGVKAA